MADTQFPPEAILFKAEQPESLEAIEYWIKQTHPQATFEQQDSMIGPLLKVDLGAYGFQVRDRQLVMKDQNNGLYSAISLNEYNEKYQ
jgi:hypothetical protein